MPKNIEEEKTNSQPTPTQPKRTKVAPEILGRLNNNQLKLVG